MLSVQDRTATPFGDVHSTTPIAATFSPDGRWVAYASTDRGKQAVYVQPFPATGAKYQLVAKGLDTAEPSGVVTRWQRTLLQSETAGVSRSSASRPRRRLHSETPSRSRRPFQLSPPEQRRAYDITPAGKFVARIPATRPQYGAASSAHSGSHQLVRGTARACADHPIADDCAVDASSAISFRERSKAVGV